MSSGEDTSNRGRREPAANEPTALQRAIAALEKMKARLDAVERAANEIIAVVGMSCRFPGGGSGPEAFWHALNNGVDAVREIPANRWSPDAIPGDPQAARWASMIDDIETFDAAFFEMSRREAETLDPQQRMLLEVTYEALEDAGLRTDLLFGSRTGVFVGISSVDYQYLVGDSREGTYDAYCTTGNTLSTAAGRIAFALGFQGPAISIDTACSSSLVAIAQACQALRLGDCNVAIAGGVNAILAPRAMAMVLETQALAPDGRCKTLDARANGFVRGEGCGILVLKRLSDALRDGDHIRALIRGWAINQNGRSTGLTAPSMLAQQRVIQQALERAKVSPADIEYVEMHGSGTSLGDPIEVEALREVLGAPRPDGSSCVLGAVKTNIGTLEAASGVAGFIKAVLALEHEKIPKNLHFRRLNPRISLDGTCFVVPTESRPWPRGSRPRRAGVTATGFSGTNAHIVLEEAPREGLGKYAEKASAYLLPLSAKSPEALTAMAQTYSEWFSQGGNESLPDVAYTAGVRRTHHEHRLAIVAHTHEELAGALQSIARGELPIGGARGRVSPRGAPQIAFVFSEQGSQWAGMGKSLLAEEPVFRAKIEEIDALMRKHAPFSLIDELCAPEGVSRLEKTEVAQPALFALQMGLVELLKFWGVMSNAVIGHGVGEIAAAHVSGALSLEDAVRLVVLRGRIMQKATGQGKMVWVALPSADAESALAGFEDDVAIAAINDPTSVVLSGASNVLDAIVADLSARGVETRSLHGNDAFHCPQMAPFAEELVAALHHIDARDGNVALYSTVTGARIDGHLLSPSYWSRNVRETVNLANAMQAALADEHRAIIEIGPHPVLLVSLQQCATAQNAEASIIPTLRKKSGSRRDMLEALGTLHVHGFNVDWKLLYPNGGRVISLPTYPWQRQRYWIEEVVRNRPGGDLLNGEENNQIPQANSDDGIRQALDAAYGSEKSDMLEQHVRDVLGQILKLSPERVDREAPFSTLGMDSLMGLELRNRLARSLGIDLPATLIFAQPTLSALIEHLVERLELGELAHEGTEESVTQEPNTPAANIETPADDDIEARLQAKLASLNKYLD